jgi:capsular polysaccharide biosynthesis protein
MKLNKKSFQKFFKFISYSLFKILYGSVEGIIDPNNNDEIEIKFVKKNGKINYNVYKVKNGRLYTDRINDTAIIKNNKVVKDASFQFRDKKIKVVNASAEENIVFEKGTPRIKRKINGKVLSLLTGGAGNDNYSHWLFDVLPRIALCEEVLDISKVDFFLLPSIEKKFQKETLDLLNIKKNKCLSSKAFRHITTSELIVTDHPYCITNNATNDIMNMPLWISEWLKKKYLKKEKKALKHLEKIFIDRSDSTSNTGHLRKIINESDVKNCLIKNNFKPVILGELHFQKQVEIFNNADVIVGLHGAGLANLCFCKAGTKLVELKNNTAGTQYENLAIKNGLIYKSISCQPSKFDYKNQFGHINVPIKKLEEFIKDSYGS